MTRWFGFEPNAMPNSLELEAQVIAHEQIFTTNPAPRLDEQTALADHAVTDFERIRELLADGRVSRLDAIRLNNDFPPDRS